MSLLLLTGTIYLVYESYRTTIFSEEQCFFLSMWPRCNERVRNIDLCPIVTMEVIPVLFLQTELGVCGKISIHSPSVFCFVTLITTLLVGSWKVCLYFKTNHVYVDRTTQSIYKTCTKVTYFVFRKRIRTFPE